MKRHEFTDPQWALLSEFFPPRVPKPGGQWKDDRMILNGVFWRLNTGAPWRDLPERYGPYTTVYNRFNRWRKAGIWDKLMDAIVKAHEGEVQMIDSSIVRVHQHASGVKKRVEFVVSVEAAAGSRRKSTRGSTPKAGRSAS